MAKKTPPANRGRFILCCLNALKEEEEANIKLHT